MENSLSGVAPDFDRLGSIIPKGRSEDGPAAKMEKNLGSPRDSAQEGLSGEPVSSRGAEGFSAQSSTGANLTILRAWTQVGRICRSGFPA